MTKAIWFLTITLAAGLTAFAAPAAAQQSASPTDLARVVEGRAAPDFDLKDQNGQPVRLSALRGKNVVLVFYRGHW